jgi:hypothetical protein
MRRKYLGRRDDVREAPVTGVRLFVTQDEADDDRSVRARERAADGERHGRRAVATLRG